MLKILLRGISAAGSAQHWQCWGQGFESPILHFCGEYMSDNFEAVGSILNSKNFSYINSDFPKLIENWEDIIGKVYASKTQVASISFKNNKTIIYINVSSGSVIQDLSFYKKNILYKIKSKFNISADEIVFQLQNKINKNTDVKVKPSITQKTYFENPTDNDLKDIELDKEDLKAIEKIKAQTFLEDEKKQSVVEFIIKDLKTQKWMKKQGYPVCKNCGKIVRYKNFNEDVYCEACKYLLENKEI